MTIRGLQDFDRVLSGRGYAVVSVSDGAEALRKIAAEEYDAVFTASGCRAWTASRWPSTSRACSLASGSDREWLRHGRERGARQGGWRVGRIAQAAVTGDDRKQCP